MTPLPITELKTIGAERFAIQFDELDEVYGCGEDSEFVRCRDCMYLECPARGKRKEAGDEE